LAKCITTGSGARELVLEVAAEPRLNSFSATGIVTIDSARDEHGTMLEAVIGAADGLAVFANREATSINLNAALNGNMVRSSTYVPSPPSNQAKVYLSKPAPSSTQLVELSGKVLVQARVDTAPLVVVDRIMEAAGRTVRGESGTAVTVNKVTRLAGGDVRIDAALEMNAGVMGFNAAGGPNNVIIQGAIIQQMNGNNVVIAFDSGPTVANDNDLKLVDAKGEAYAVHQVFSPSMRINNGNISRILQLVYRPKAGQGPPAQLVLSGHSLFAFEVPFSFKNVRLP
jgi:hypothetical protein